MASPLARLTIAQAIGPLGDSMATLAVILHLQSTGGTGTTVAAVMFAEAIPPILSPVAGTIADRARDPRRLIAAASLLQAAVLVGMATVLPSLGLVAIAALLFARALIDTAAYSAYNAAVPAVVASGALPRANTIIASAREAGMIIGPPIAGLIFAASGARLALAIDAITFVAVVPLVLGLPTMVSEHTPGTWRTDIAEGIGIVWHHKPLRAIAIGFWVLVFFSAPDDLVMVFLARDDFDATPFETGLLVAGAGIGLVAATPLIAGARRWLSTPFAAILAGGLVACIGNLLTAVAPALGVAFATQALRGSGVGLFDAAGVRVFIQQHVPPRLLGRVFANVYGGVGVAAALGYVAAGPFLDATSPRVSFVVIGAGGLVGLVVMLVLRAPSTTTLPTEVS